MQAVTPTYAIFLPEREGTLRAHLQLRAVAVKFFPAFKGNQLGVATSHVLPWPYYKPPKVFETSSRLALCLGWFALIKVGLAEGYEEMLVFEDDVRLCEHFHERYARLRERLPPDFGFFFLGHNAIKEEMKPVAGADGIAEGVAHCTHAVLVSRAAMQLIDEKSKLYVGMDIFLINDVFPRTKVYYAYPDKLAWQASELGEKLPSTLD